jgi:hypothetical protein
MRPSPASYFLIGLFFGTLLTFCLIKVDLANLGWGLVPFVAFVLLAVSAAVLAWLLRAKRG